MKLLGVLSSLCLCVLAKQDELSTDGDVIFGGLFPIHEIGKNEKECGRFNENTGYQYMEAMLYAIDKINQNPNILPGIRLGTLIYDTCRSPTIVADKTLKFIKRTQRPRAAPNRSELAGVIGPYKSDNSVIVANFFRVFKIPQVSYGSATVELSKKDQYQYFFRTIPPSSFLAEALVKLLKELKWSYVSLVHSSGLWPETETKEIEKIFRRENICIGYKHQLDRFPKQRHFNNLVDELVSDSSRPSVVILITIPRDSRLFLEAKKRDARGIRLSLVSSIEWSNRLDITKDLEEVADGLITFGLRQKKIVEFERYYEDLHVNNYSRSRQWFNEHLRETGQCNVSERCWNNNKTCNETCTSHKEFAPVHVVINAVQAMANALHALQQHRCPQTRKLCGRMRPLPRNALLKFLKNVTFEDAAFHHLVKFNDKQEVDGNYSLFNFRRINDRFTYACAGSWISRLNSNGSITGTLFLNQSKLRWANGSKTAPLSTCRPDCGRKEKRVLRDDNCCWKCESCGKNDVIINNTCKKCTAGFVPDRNHLVCSKLPLKSISPGDSLYISITFLSCVGILADLVTFATFFANRRHRLVKASGREMCYIMFIGICMIFMVPLLSLIQPTQELCYFRRFITGISLTTCYAPLLMKVWRIHRIFTESANHLRRLSSGGLIGRRFQLMTTISLIGVQSLLCAFVFLTDPPKLTETFYQKRNEFVIECSLRKPMFVAFFIYNAFLLLCCTRYAFLTRNFPKNFNEAMYIGFTMYFTCVVWIVLFAGIFNADYSISRVYWISGCSLVIGWITLVGLFAPKLYQLYTKTEFSKEMLITWTESPSRPIASSVVSAECQRCKALDNQLKPLERVRIGRNRVGCRAVRLSV